MTVARASTVEIQPPQEEDWARALSAITSAQRIVLACHVNPDGDALGSMLAAALGLRRYGAQVQATFPSPFQLPKMFMTLPGLDLLEPPGKVDPEPEVLLCFDAASAERLGDLTDRMARAREVVVIDHHASNTGFGTIHLVDPRAAATAVVVDELLQRLGVPLDTAIAECLYVALSTDTGSFKYQATSPREHLLAARLLETGIRQDEICRRLFDSRPYGALKLLGEMLDRAVLEPDSAQGVGLVWTYATQDDLSRHQLPPYVLESMIDVLRTTEEADVACVLKEVTPGEWAVSLRSKGAVNVARTAIQLGGGGHRYAAGFTGRGELAEIVTAIRNGLVPQQATREKAGAAAAASCSTDAAGSAEGAPSTDAAASSAASDMEE